MTEENKTTRGQTKFKEGVVVSNKMNKTVVIGVTGKKKHPRYGKYISFSKKFVAHDEENRCKIGDSVKIMETRPLSKTKCWKVVEILRTAVLDETGQTI